MSEYRIEKTRQRVTIALVGGATLEGDVFLQPTARYRAGPQPPEELFNEEEPFLPVAAAGDHLVLVAKDQITRVQFADDAADTDMEGVVSAPVDLVFIDGSMFAGDLRLETRASRPRLLDFLNEERQRFMTLRFTGGVCLVNRRLISQVRQRR